MRRFQPQPILFLVFLLGATAPLPAQGPESGKPLPASEWDESDRSPGAGRIRLTAAELLFQFPPADVPPDEPDSTATVPAESMRADDSAESSNDNRFNPAVVAQGEAAFQRGCLDCHDAARSYEKTKTLSGWISTTRRMAAKDGADVPEGDIVPIATYLASRSAPGPGAGNGDAPAEESSYGNGLSFNATVSTLARFGEDTHTLESPGIFPDIWLGADWQPAGPLSAKVMACTSCHSDGGFTFELVEASATLDLLQAFCGDRKQGRQDRCPGWEAKLKAGRFVAPFGAFAAMSHPGAYRTLTNPLIFDMGRDVAFNGGPLVVPIVMQPYSDEGAQFSLRIPLPAELSMTFDAYGVNGLRDPSFSFFTSRSYRDNNREPAAGGRVTIGSSQVRFGTSVMGGNSGNTGNDLHYVAAGADFTARIADLLRIYAEYAWRRHDSSFVADGEDVLDGYVAEAELFIWDDPGISLLARYDTIDMSFSGPLLPGGSVERFTWGFNIGLPGGSLLLIHHERWNPQPGNNEFDLVGARWTCTF